MSAPVGLTILGAGHQGLAMAAHLGSNGIRCGLWNRGARGIEGISKAGCVVSRGVIEGEIPVPVVSSDYDEVASGVILVAAPSSAHRDIARMLARRVGPAHLIVLNPGRTFGALDFARSLRDNGCTELPTIVETQTIIYTCRRSGDNGVTVYALKDGVPASAIGPLGVDEALECLPSCFSGHLKPCESILETSLGNVGMVLHCVPTLMNVGWIESASVPFKFYHQGISPSVAAVCERLDSERMAVAEACGARIESVSDWIHRTYGVKGATLYEGLQANCRYEDIVAPSEVRHRYIEEDVPNGLVPLESLGAALEIPTPVTSGAISLANAALGKDYRETGRKLSDYLDMPDLPSALQSLTGCQIL